MQQFVKILMASHIEENAMMFCDSDVFFLKPFNLSNLSRGNKIRFGSVESQPNPDDKMIIPSIELLGVKQSEVRRLILGDQIVVWHRPTVIAMQRYLTILHGRPWHEAIGSKLMFSEYQLYALFVNYIQKNNEYLYEDATVYCKGLWTKADAKSIDLAKFCSELAPHEVAVCIQSLIGVDVNLLKPQFELALSE
jgi:hypothetical protein